MKRLWRGLVLAALCAPIAAGAVHRTPSRWRTTLAWSVQKTPKAGPPLAIGAYNAGCLQGAEPLAPEGQGFELLHFARRRYFGHPELLRFVRRLAAAAAGRHLPALLVGDLSQARGGPTPSDHGSHQSGLDVDISYTRPSQALKQPLTRAEREALTFPGVVDVAAQRLTPLWRPEITELLELAASDPSVDRIFVNAVVKREMCARRQNVPWLRRLRPWWGHDDHFHVRLECPAGSRSCRPQDPVPEGDGCDATLAWWLSDEARAALAKRRQLFPRTIAPALPGECRAVLR